MYFVHYIQYLQNTYCKCRMQIRLTSLYGIAIVYLQNAEISLDKDRLYFKGQAGFDSCSYLLDIQLLNNISLQVGAFNLAFCYLTRPNLGIYTRICTK